MEWAQLILQILILLILVVGSYYYEKRIAYLENIIKYQKEIFDPERMKHYMEMGIEAAEKKAEAIEKEAQASIQNYKTQLEEAEDKHAKAVEIVQKLTEENTNLKLRETLLAAFSGAITTAATAELTGTPAHLRETLKFIEILRKAKESGAFSKAFPEVREK